MNSLMETPITPYNVSCVIDSLACLNRVRRLQFQTDGNAYVFYVQGSEAADQIKSLSRRISAPNGFKFAFITTRANNPPQPHIDEELSTLIKDVMSKRYDTNQKLLDLSNFKNDQGFRERELFVPLSRANILSVVVKIIKENIPDLRLLDLSNNHISALEPLLSLSETCKLLKGINLQKNQVSSSDRGRYFIFAV